MDIRVECATPDGLSGKKRFWFRGIFHLIGILGKSPFVSQLRKLESAPTQPHRGYRYGYDVLRRRVFSQFSWLEVDSIKMMFSRLTHQRVRLPPLPGRSAGVLRKLLGAGDIRY